MIASGESGVALAAETVGKCRSCAGGIGDDLDDLPQQNQGVDRHGDQPAAEAQKAAQLDECGDCSIGIADDLSHGADEVLALDRLDHVASQQVADLDGLREPHGGRGSQAHTRRWGRPSRGGTLRKRGTAQAQQNRGRDGQAASGCRHA